MQALRQVALAYWTVAALVLLTWSGVVTSSFPSMVSVAPCGLADQPAGHYKHDSIVVTFRTREVPWDVPILIRFYGGTSIERVIPWSTGNDFLARTFLVEGSNLNVGALICTLGHRADVEHVEPNYIVTLQ